MHSFPTPYPDELLFSVLSRYQMRVGNISPKKTTEDLYGKRTIRSVLDMPGNLNLLADRINNPLINADYLIDHHTMFPFYGAFFLKEQYDNVRTLMKSEYGERVHTTSGISASNITPNEYLMHCEKCCEEDHEKYGETYWHRIHQLPGVFVCHKHEILLHETNVAVKAKNQHEYVIATEENTRKQSVAMAEYTHFDHLLAFAKLASELLMNNFRQNQDNHLRLHYKRKLSENGLITTCGFMNRGKLYPSFRAFFGEITLERLQSPIQFAENDWLTMIFQHHRKSFHPIRHILVMLFLGGSLSSYFGEPSSYLPFGEGPWLCLNPICDDYQKAVVTDLKVTRCYSTKRPVGTYRCHCGFTYSRKGPDQSQDDQFKIGCIKEFGHVWKNKLKGLISESGTLTGIAKALQCDPQTVKRQAVLLNLPFSWSGESLDSAIKKPRFQKGKGIKLEKMDLAPQKNEWLFLQEQHPDLSKTELRLLRPDLYALLYRCDQDWLYEHSPKGRKHINVNNRVNWEERDAELLGLVEQAVTEWDIDSDKPVRITLGAIGIRINALSLLQKKANRLPETTIYIKSVVEDIETFQLRRVRWIAEKMKDESEEILEWKLYQKAGLRPNVSNKVKRLITLLASEYDYIQKIPLS